MCHSERSEESYSRNAFNTKRLISFAEFTLSKRKILRGVYAERGKILRGVYAERGKILRFAQNDKREVP